MFSVYSKFNYVKHHPKTKHFGLVAQFLVFSVVLVTADITTDILTAKDFFLSGDTNWALFTLLPVLAPFAARIVLSINNYFRTWKSFQFSEELSQIFWHFPLFHPIRLNHVFIN